MSIGYSANDKHDSASKCFRELYDLGRSDEEDLWAVKAAEKISFYKNVYTSRDTAEHRCSWFCSFQNLDPIPPPPPPPRVSNL